MIIFYYIYKYDRVLFIKKYLRIINLNYLKDFPVPSKLNPWILKFIPPFFSSSE